MWVNILHCTGLNPFSTLSHFSAVNMLTWWYSRMLPSLSDTVLIWISHFSISKSDRNSLSFVGIPLIWFPWHASALQPFVVFRLLAPFYSGARPIKRESKINKSYILSYTNYKIRSKKQRQRICWKFSPFHRKWGWTSAGTLTVATVSAGLCLSTDALTAWQTSWNLNISDPSLWLIPLIWQISCNAKVFKLNEGEVVVFQVNMFRQRANLRKQYCKQNISLICHLH